MVSMIVPKSEPHRIFGITLRRMRERTGETPFVIAAAANVQKKSLTEYELGLKAPVDIDRVHRLCDALGATEDERTALIECWGSIGSNNRLIHVAALLGKHRQMHEDPDQMLTPVDPELRRLQDVIDALKRSSHDDAPFMWAGVLDCVKKIQAQGETWLKQSAKA